MSSRGASGGVGRSFGLRGGGGSRGGRLGGGLGAGQSMLDWVDGLGDVDSG